ncbi:MAG: YegS/Rv2252/BmrU family lipid kinase [Clostridia bacterium]|nr:YegS/Rv2252/BmrU family lipid kinase [Clostridia bacterium]
MQKKLYFIANPCSGTGRIKTQLYPIVQVFADGGYDVTVHFTSDRGDATVQTAALDDSYDTIVCCGGDGTLNEVITGLMQNKNTYRLGYIPAGTLNEWSGGLKISRNMKKAAEDILQNNLVPLDIGKFGDHYFSYTASFGAFTEASYSAPQNVKNMLGKVAYFFEGIKTLNNIRPIPLTVCCDGKEVSGEFIFGTVSNSLSVGGVVHYNEALVELGDGLFEVLLIRYPKSLAELNNAVTAILSKNFTHEGIEFMQAKNIVFKNAGEVDWTLDGEHITPQDTIEVTNLHSAVNFLIPLNGKKTAVKG